MQYPKAIIFTDFHAHEVVRRFLLNPRDEQITGLLLRWNSEQVVGGLILVLHLDKVVFVEIAKDGRAFQKNVEEANILLITTVIIN